MNEIGRRRTALLALLAVAACRDVPTAPPGPLRPAGPGSAMRVMEVSISGIGAERMSAAVRFPAAGRDGPRLDFAPVGGADGGGDGTLQMQPLAAGSFRHREAGGATVRYLYATFRVRNAREDGTPYDTPRRNLTFLAVSTAATLRGTPISALRLFDETLPADPDIALQIVPTGAVMPEPRTGAPLSAGPDVLQVLEEGEAAAVAAPAPVTSVFPYGFVVRGAGGAGVRTLAASPPADQFDGVVTFAFKLPLQPTAAQDPYAIRMMFLPVDDGETRLTQSLQEQTPAGDAAVRLRASLLGATTVTLLPWATLALPGTRLICTVRIAGTVAAPTAFLVDGAAVVPPLSPGRFTGAASFLPTTSSFSARFPCTMSGVDARTFTVSGSQRGRYFLGASYSGNGTTTLTTPTGSFFPGEEVEVALTGALGARARQVARYRMAASPASATFAPAPGSPIAVAPNPRDVAVADFDGDGKLDLAVAHSEKPWVEPPRHGVWVMLGDGLGRFVPTPNNPVFSDPYPTSVEAGDVNADGRPDLVVSSRDRCVRVWLGDGAGGFAEAPGSPISTGVLTPMVALGDLNADGFLDFVAARVYNLSAYLGDGTGRFTLAPGSPIPVAGADPHDLAMGDLNQDGKLDLVVSPTSTFSPVAVLLGDGTGRFTRAQAPVASGPSGFSPQTGDFNGDGRLDVAMPSSSQGDRSYLFVLLGDGRGGLANAPGSPFVVSRFTHGLAVGDLNGDARLDLALAQPDEPSNNLALFLGDGSGRFSPAPGSPIAAGYSPHTPALGDFNGDGRLDIVLSARGSDRLFVLLNQPVR